MRMERILTTLKALAITLLVTGAILGQVSNPASASHVVAISAGGQHTCALTTAGGVQCWGRNASGQLGDGTGLDSITPVDVVGLSTGVATVSAGAIHTCALMTDGGVKCWGENNPGRLGDGTTDDSLVPVDVVGLQGTASGVTAGFSHSCALMKAGGVQCWGTGYGLTPVGVPGLENVVTVGAGFWFTCALTESGGVACWGNNAGGHLGDGTNTDSATPVGVVGLESGVAAIAVGEQDTCALMATGTLACWGLNVAGELGDGTQTSRNSPVVVCADEACASPLSGVVAVSANGLHACSLMEAGNLKCWGYNFEGQLGDGTSGGNNLVRTTPVDVVVVQNSVLSVAAGGVHTCAIVATGAVVCWGSDLYGQLGDSDGDGCTDFAEHGSDPAQGGLRDHQDVWDFFDTPDASNVRDRVITMSDTFAVATRFGAVGDGGGDPLAGPIPAAPAYHAAFDRGGQVGDNAWNQAPADGSITIGDVFAVAGQFGHTCA